MTHLTRILLFVIAVLCEIAPTCGGKSELNDMTTTKETYVLTDATLAKPNVSSLGKSNVATDFPDGELKDMTTTKETNVLTDATLTKPNVSSLGKSNVASDFPDGELNDMTTTKETNVLTDATLAKPNVSSLGKSNVASDFPDGELNDMTTTKETNVLTDATLAKPNVSSLGKSNVASDFPDGELGDMTTPNETYVLTNATLVEHNVSSLGKSNVATDLPDRSRVSTATAHLLVLKQGCGNWTVFPDNDRLYLWHGGKATVKTVAANGTVQQECLGNPLNDADCSYAVGVPAGRYNSVCPEEPGVFTCIVIGASVQNGEDISDNDMPNANLQHEDIART
ncbi:uncharacterized protein LOC124149456 isoform X4 [Haliotis rufescens]|uniref:uncharacterized protein LOC124149456 isoform X4 n=1 Tax=Haliotis rufescens TaxID=6454 RepID=UPI00201F5ADF|nr:uncharacterized protein LOC124149456 isoform X4 [Haliotis rufescens]